MLVAYLAAQTDYLSAAMLAASLAPLKVVPLAFLWVDQLVVLRDEKSAVKSASLLVASKAGSSVGAMAEKKAASMVVKMAIH